MAGAREVIGTPGTREGEEEEIGITREVLSVHRIGEGSVEEGISTTWNRDFKAPSLVLLKVSWSGTRALSQKVILRCL